MTARGIGLLAGSVALWLIGRTLGLPELFIAAASGGALVGLAAVVVRLPMATVSVDRRVARTRLPAGASSAVELLLRARCWLPAVRLEVEEGCPPALRPDGVAARFGLSGVTPGTAVPLRYELQGHVRGRHRLGPLRLRTRDPFGLAQRVRLDATTDEVVVYPRVEPLGEGLARGNHRGSEASDTRRLFTSGDEFYTLREYVTGDDLRQVHWPSTAHHAKLMVRQQELPWRPEAVLFCDARAHAHRGAGPDSTLEKAVSVTASVACHLADHRYELRLATEADARRPSAETSDDVLARLAELVPSDRLALAPTLSRVRGPEAGGLFVAVVAPPTADAALATHPDVRAMLACGRRFAERLAIVVVSAADRRHRDRGARLAGLLATSGWKAVVIDPGESLAARWPDVVRARRRLAPGVRR